MDLASIKSRKTRRARRKRIGCGRGSGHGKTSCRGHKGAKSRSGWSRRHMTGGQMPLFRRLPKRGFSNADFAKEYSIVNIRQLAGFDAGTDVDPDVLRSVGLVKQMGKDGVKVLGDGFLDKALNVRVHAISGSAREKIVAAGGTVEIIPPRNKPVRNKMKPREQAPQEL
jgi:large subunit ribosomal protein L15